MKHTPKRAILAGSIALASASAAALASPLPRAIQAFPRPKADGQDPAKILTQLQTDFAAYKQANDEKLSGKADVVVDEKIAKIDASVTNLQAAIDEMSKRAAAAQLAGGGNGTSPEAKAYSEKFNAWFRRGDLSAHAELPELAVKAALTRTSDPDGGIFVPSEMETTIDRVLGKTSAVRELATVRTVGGGGYKKPVNLGGTSSGWTDNETDAPTQTSTPKLSILDFGAKTLWAQPAITQSMLEDAYFDIAGWLADEVSIEFAEQEGAAFINGDGLKSPKGILAYKTVADANYKWGSLGYISTGAAGALGVAFDALQDLVYAPKSAYRNNARFLMNRKSISTVRKVKDGEGNYMWEPSNKVGEPAQFMGYAVSDDDNMPDFAPNAFPIAFGDFARGYLVADRRGVQVLRDPYSAKPYVLFWTTKRVGGGVQDFAAIKLLKAA
jgi:HK97 family phage major capsid protein